MDALGIIGAITGALGLLVSIVAILTSVLVTRWQAKLHTQEMAEERAERERLNRLAFLADRIFDLSIPRELRLPFYEEYISMKGNGTAVRFWLTEESREKQR
ncbi:MAG: hypothetical protein LBH20_07045 [Treponema sp.]|jgi:hypothetical protein|nr:hypothetical protein [Treponema sp.]